MWVNKNCRETISVPVEIHSTPAHTKAVVLVSDFMYPIYMGVASELQAPLAGDRNNIGVKGSRIPPIEI